MTHSHVAFRLALRLRSPVVLTDFAPTLDALIYEALSQQSPAASRQELLDEIQEYLSFHAELGVFHGSSMRFGLTPEHGLLAASYTRVDGMTDSKLNSAMIGPTGRNGRYSRIVLAGGPTKKRLRSMPAYTAPFAIFDGYGSPWRIKALLEFYVMGVGYDAQNVQMGAFDQVTVVLLDEDVSIMNSGAASRPLPASCGLTGEPGESPLQPPYYQKDKAKIVAPTKVRADMLEKLI